VVIKDQAGVRSRAHDLRRLALASGGLAAATAGFLPLHRLYSERDLDHAPHVPHPGWQVDATEASLGVLLVLAMVGAALVLARAWRRARAHSPFRLLPLLAGFAPGLALGLTLSYPFGQAVELASDHTDSAAATRRGEQQRLAEFQLSPAVSVHASSAPAALAAVLLRPSDLGQGWYDAFRPNPAAAHQAPGQKPVVGARSALVRTHRTQHGWSLADPLLTEVVDVLGSPAAATAAISVATQPPPDMRVITRRVLGVRVTQLVTPRGVQGERAGFVVGRYAFALRCDGMPGSTFDPIVDAAEKRALDGS
jgi:hypothetical protein